MNSECWTQEFDGKQQVKQSDSSSRLSVWEHMQVMLAAAGVSAVIAMLFYNCIQVMLILPVCFHLLKKRKKAGKRKKQNREIEQQFLDAIKAVSAALLAGFSVENAWVEAQKEMESLYGKESALYIEISKINRKAAMSVPIEDAVSDFASETGAEDIVMFAEVFRFAKRSGGNLIKIMETTVCHIRQKQETMQEIEIMIAAKRLEQKIMNGIPVFILFYLRLTSEGYLDILYGNLAGAAFMTAALGAYLFSMQLAEKIMNITV